MGGYAIAAGMVTVAMVERKAPGNGTAAMSRNSSAASLGETMPGVASAASIATGGSEGGGGGSRGPSRTGSALNLEEAAALYDEVVEHYTVVVGPEHKAVKANKAVAARLRAALA